MIKSNYVSRVM